MLTLLPHGLGNDAGRLPRPEGTEPAQLMKSKDLGCGVFVADFIGGAEDNSFSVRARGGIVFGFAGNPQLFQAKGLRRLSRAMVHRILKPALTVPERVPETLDRPRRGR